MAVSERPRVGVAPVPDSHAVSVGPATQEGSPMMTTPAGLAAMPCPGLAAAWHAAVAPEPVSRRC